MPRRLTEKEWGALIAETDEFRLAIRGAAGIEAEVDAAIADGFSGSVPDELQPPRARFELRLAILVGLGVIPDAEAAMVRKLSWVRNKFAHGEFDGLTPAIARDLVVAARAVGPTPPGDEWLAAERSLAESSTHLSLATLLMACHIVVTQSAEHARHRREQERAIVEQHRAVERGEHLQAVLETLRRDKYQEPNPGPEVE
jgi:hypothetical protein